MKSSGHLVGSQTAWSSGRGFQQGNAVLETLALGVFEPGDYEFQVDSRMLPRGVTFLSLRSGSMVQRVQLKAR